MCPRIFKPDDTIPLFSFETACGPFRDAGFDISSNARVILPRGIRSPRLVDGREDMFCCRANGDSMWPLLPNGDYGIFIDITGTRLSRYVLVEDWSRLGEDRFTLKRYERVVELVDGKPQRVRILLHPLNSNHDIIELDPNNDEVNIRAVWLKTIRAAEIKLIKPLYSELDESPYSSTGW